MRPAHIVEIVTPNSFLLNGIWHGPKRPKRTVVWVHGLSSSAFSKQSIVEHLIDRDTAVLTFNNRGHDNVARLPNVLTGKSLIAGAAYEKFEDCIDDIQGAINFAKKRGAREIYIAGHSTGCQKAAYWAAKKGKGVKGIILLAAVSDYSAMLAKYGAPKISHMQAIAKSMLKSGRENEFVSSKFWSDEPNTPKRFLSLYTPDSVEQSIFSYFDQKKPATMLKKISLPLLVILGEQDEYLDRPASAIVDWFEKHTKAPLLSLVAKRANHGFKGHETAIAKAIKLWIAKK